MNKEQIKENKEAEFKTRSMASAESKLKAYEMYLEGKTYREIGEHLGVSKQYIEQTIPKDRKTFILTEKEMEAFPDKNDLQAIEEANKQRKMDNFRNSLMSKIKE